MTHLAPCLTLTGHPGGAAATLHVRYVYNARQEITNKQASRPSY